MPTCASKYHENVDGDARCRGLRRPRRRRRTYVRSSSSFLLTQLERPNKFISEPYTHKHTCDRLSYIISDIVAPPPPPPPLFGGGARREKRKLISSDIVKIRRREFSSSLFGLNLCVVKRVSAMQCVSLVLR